MGWKIVGGVCFEKFGGVGDCVYGGFVVGVYGM